MDAATILADQQTSLPIAAGADYYKRLAAYLDRYRVGIDNLKATDYVTARLFAERDRVSLVCDRLLAAVRDNSGGHTSDAQSHFDAAIKLLNPELAKLRSSAVPATKVPRLYRIRDAEDGSTVDLGGIFHLPAQLRGMASAARYSLTNQPSLYLSRSIYIAWLETGANRLTRPWVSAFQLEEQDAIRVLDFGYTPELVAAMIPAGSNAQSKVSEFAAAYVIALPLIAACSACRNTLTKDPPEEFALPQMILRWLPSGSDLIGIRYFSTRDVEAESGLFVQNYVFPAFDLGTTGYSPRLKRAFAWTNPAPLERARVSGASCSPTGRNETKFTSQSGLICAYGTTSFAAAEAWLETQPLYSL